MKTIRLLFLLAVFPLAAFGDSIRPSAIRAHMSFLADDLLEGRDTATRGYDLAARYVASQFDAYGLTPGGDGGTFYQQVPLRRATFSSASAEWSGEAGKRKLVLDRDFIVGARFTPGTHTVIAPVVIVGHGITAPELKHDDYAGLDVRGKIVIGLGGAPAHFPDLARAHYSSGLVKIRNAASRGAAGVINVDPPELAKLFPWTRAVVHSHLPYFRWIERDGTIHNTFPQLVVASLSHEGAAAILGEAGLARLLDDAKDGKRSGLHPKGELTISISFDSERVTSPNVIGILPGSDPQLKNEYFVYTAHLDHVGVATPVGGDAIYNGAVDNASGVAGMLEIARLFADRQERPKRSIVFLAVTGEEKGLLGSDYFANQPTVPANAIVANLNIDGLHVFAPPADVVVLGVDNSTLGAHARAAARSAGLEIAPDPRPEQVFFIRSDQYSFVKVGIPALFPMPGQKSADASVDAKKMLDDYLTSRYHMPGDDMSQPLSFEGGARIAQFYFLTGLSVANAPERPAWNKGDFFGETFGRNRP